ncbi:SDR family NAD(P)-dependent oxidoreductase [Amycolatopsis sp. SID8362]|uniref:SDR family NAD(P)-dependent oxidoreductase n=1 Tax=Amycolatopsis sp. SID8362 TaxID=2690346 RepID=UPI00136FCDFC|nr:SDR family NAD(P)-dependent oxidoreductase [Amycolatopsis sp. SID8362]NBH06070.1 SDR family NAD(P)-dependent oxidoreductase [Amycolatopsis sp. SID8362]NED42769.1 SDR family NAD(P)-dependent oxidoreductase [Amycolatopsis sp. SID8362]
MTAQQPIGSGYGADTTTTDVLADVDLTGKLAVVTGASSGLGLATAHALGDAGATVIAAVRRPETAAQAFAQADRVEIRPLDLADQASVHAFADEFLASGRELDMLINNAGVMLLPETRVGPGWEAQFATNHLGHYTLTNRLWPALTSGRGARVVSLSSFGHRYSAMRWDDVMFKAGYDKILAYGQAKTANALFAVHLDTLGREHNVRAFAVHPGGIMTSLQRHMSQEEMRAVGWVDDQGNTASSFKTPAQGAATQVWAATSPKLADAGGVYLQDCDIAPIVEDDAPGVRPYAVDPEEAGRLWALSAQLTEVGLTSR